eukprot:3781585-Rhodomonas_salina.1
MEHHWREAERNAGYLHRLRSQILASQRQSQTLRLCTLRLRARQEQESAVDELGTLEDMEESLARAYLSQGVRQCQQALEDARLPEWEMQYGWVWPHIVGPGLRYRRPGR